jgi:hypothetical protein
LGKPFDLDQGSAHGRETDLPPQSLKRGDVMSLIDILYLAVVLIAVAGFAVTLAYYSSR